MYTPEYQQQMAEMRARKSILRMGTPFDSLERKAREDVRMAVVLKNKKTTTAVLQMLSIFTAPAEDYAQATRTVLPATYFTQSTADARDNGSATAIAGMDCP
jgi:hypothetical protein